VYFAKTKAGEQMIFENSRVKAWLRRYLAETEWSQFIQAYVDDYVLGENKAVLNLEIGLDTKVIDGNLLKKTSVS
jgi:Phosphatidylserine decarboxylase